LGIFYLLIWVGNAKEKGTKSGLGKRLASCTLGVYGVGVQEWFNGYLNNLFALLSGIGKGSQ
jgi:hypothetical protein